MDQRSVGLTSGKSSLRREGTSGMSLLLRGFVVDVERWRTCELLWDCKAFAGRGLRFIRVVQAQLLIDKLALSEGRIYTRPVLSNEVDAARGVRRSHRRLRVDKTGPSARDPRGACRQGSGMTTLRRYAEGNAIIQGGSAHVYNGGNKATVHGRQGCRVLAQRGVCVCRADE